MASVTLINVCKKYENGFEAVHNFNLEINDKEFIILVGPSGCGKSTTMRMIAGLEEISGGIIKIGNQIVNDVPPKDRDIAMVFQDYALYPHLTVRENLSLSLKLKKAAKEEIRRRVDEAAQMLEISHLLDNKPRQMSGGQRQRVAMGRAIVRTPKVFMFDEPLSNLDPKLRNTMRVELKRLHRKLNTTIIYVTHDQVEAMTLGDRIIVMEKGFVRQIGKPLDIYNRPENKFVASFIGAPQMNFFDCEISLDNGDVCFKSSTLAVKISATQQLATLIKAALERGFPGAPQLILGIRAEDMWVVTESDARASGNFIKAVVEVLEPIAPEVYLHMKLAEQIFVVRDENVMASKVKPGETIEIAMNIEKIHLFDIREGLRIC